MKFGSLFGSSKRNRPIVHSEALEQRWMLSSSLAPRSIAGSTIEAAITTGLAPLDQGGSYTLLPAADTTYSIVNAAGGANDGSGTYSYTRLVNGNNNNGDVGVILYTDSSTGLSYNETLTFLTATAGSYVISAALPGGSGSQSGSFAFTAAPKATTSDPALSLVTTPTGTFVGGDTGTVVVEIDNTGAMVANAYVTLNLYLSTDGTVANGTPVTNVARRIQLGTAGNTNFPLRADFNIPFTYPSIVNGTFFWTVKLSPSLGLDDADQSNDTAASATMVTLSAPVIDLKETNVVVKDLTAEGVVTATKQQAIVTLLNDGNRSITGTVHFTLSTAATSEGFDTPIVPKPVPIYISLAPGKIVNVAVRFIGPNMTVSTQQYIVATVSTVGVVQETNIVNGVDLNNIINTTSPVLFTPPEVTLTDAIVGSLPASVVGGSGGSTMLQVVNDGNIPLKALLTVTLYVSADTTLDAGDSQVLFGGKNEMIAVGKSVQFPLKFTYPTTLVNGDYYLLAQVASTSMPVLGSVPPISVTAPASNVAVSATPVNISQPIVTLTANFGTMPGTAFVEGQNVILPLDLLNSGNVAAKGRYTVQLLASTSGDPSDPADIPLTTALAAKLSLAPNAVSKTTIKFKIPTGVLASGAPYFFVARIEASAIPDITDPNPTAVGSQTFTVS